MNWYYLNDSGEVAGPLSEEALKELSAAGGLSGETQVCREGTEDWIRLAEALEAATLGAPEADTDSVSADDPMAYNGHGEPSVHPEENYGRAPRDSFSDRLKNEAKAGWGEIKRTSKAASVHAQIEKLKHVDLRMAFSALGKKCYESGRLESELHSEFQLIRELDATIAGKRETTEAEADETKMAALKRMGKDAAKASHAQALSVKRQHLLTEIGRLARERLSNESSQGLEAEIAEIEKIEGNIRIKEEEARTLGAGQATGWKRMTPRIAVAAITLAVLAIAGNLLVNVFVSDSKTIAADFSNREWTKKAFSKALEIDKLQQRSIDGKTFYFLPNTENPVTGWVKEIDETSGGRTLTHLESGVRDGAWACLYKNGQLQFRGTYKDGDKHGIQESWYENGQKECERLFNKDTVVSIKKWKPSGEVCPETRFEGGNGKEISYADDGKPQTVTTWENGKGTLRFAQKEDAEALGAAMGIARAIGEASETGSHDSGRQDNSNPRNQNQDHFSSPDFEMGFRAGSIGSDLPFTNREAYLAGRRLGEESESMPAYTQGYNQGREHGVQGVTMRSNPFNRTSQKVEWLAWDHGYSIGNLEGNLSR